MEQSGLLVSENVFEPILALAEGDYGLLELTAPKEGTSTQPCQVGSLKLRIQGPFLPPTKKWEDGGADGSLQPLYNGVVECFFKPPQKMPLLHGAGLALGQGTSLFFPLCAMDSV